jgi:hypothetical protein
MCQQGVVCGGGGDMGVCVWGGGAGEERGAWLAAQRDQVTFSRSCSMRSTCSGRSASDTVGIKNTSELYLGTSKCR